MAEDDRSSKKQESGVLTSDVSLDTISSKEDVAWCQTSHVSVCWRRKKIL
jgi:hypothetical protein